MRKIKWALIAVVAAMPAMTSAQQVSPRVEEEKPAARVLGERNPFDATKREKGSYLGVSATPPPRVLRKQLGLKPGMGLVVDFVVPDSPASKAGLRQYDLLQKLDDQLIVNSQQLAVLVRSHKPDDEVRLEIIRDGKVMVLSAKLAEHELEPLAEDTESDEDAPHFPRVIPEPRIRPLTPGERFTLPPGWGGPRGRAGGSFSTTWLEENKSYTLTIDGEGHKTFIVKDRDGKVLEQGPVDTNEQREKLSPGTREKLHQLQQQFPAELPKTLPSESATQPASESSPESDSHLAKDHGHSR